ncbi:MAG TPA: hypothetical protein VFC19_35550 [Candidatus Limnocylindrales bacterium]|nr:hypothetical protein [Candidatus Limnocylindrales bacterium]
MTGDMREVKRLARQGLPHPDPAVRAAVVARQRRWYRLAWYPTILGCLSLLAVPAFIALEEATRDWWWMGAVPLAIVATGLLTALAFGLWVTGLRSGWLAAPNLPEVPPAPLPLRVRSRLMRSPMVLVYLTLPLMIVEWIVIAITAERPRMAAMGFLPAVVIPSACTLFLFVSPRLLGPQVIIDADGVRLPSVRLALAWEQVAEIRSSADIVAGLAILPHPQVTLPSRARWLSHRIAPWLLVSDVMMAVAVETVVSTAIHARNARLEHVGEVDRAG